MNNREFFMERWEPEQAIFVKVLRAIPDGKLDYRPHERSSGAGALAWQLADEQRQLCELLDTGEVNFELKPHPDTMGEIVAEFERATNDLRKRLKSTTDEQWSTKGDFIVDGSSVWSDTIGNLFWGYLFDMVHHRGQLSAYIRPMGGKVPAIYGPSADETGS